MIVLRNILLTVIGLSLYTTTVMFPILRLVFFDWIALVVIILPWVLDVISMYREDTIKDTDTVKKWETLVHYIDRNRDVHPLITKRPYHTQSFLEAKGFGLIENKGKDSVLKKGGKKYVLAVENCEHTPDPDMIDSSQILNELGIKDMDTLRKLLTGMYLDAGDFKMMGQSLVSMMTYNQRHGAHKLVQEWRDYDGKNFEFTPVFDEKMDLHARVDEVLSNRFTRR